MHVVEQLAVALVAALVLLGPGTTVVAARRMHRTLPGPLLAPTAFLLTLVLLAVVTVVALVLHLGMALVVPVFAAAWLAGWVNAVLVTRHDDASGWPRVHTLGGLWRRAVSVARLAAHRPRPRGESSARLDAEEVRRAEGLQLGTWRAIVAASPIGALVALPLPLLFLTAVATLGAFTSGGWLTDGDALYHVSVAEKLQHFGHPTFANVQPFVDGSAHPGYLVPVWHELLALVAWLAGATPATVVWVLPAVVTPLGALTMAGLAQTLLRSPRAGLVGAASWLLADVAMSAPGFGLVASASFPATIDIVVLLPLAAALWINTLWNTRSATRRQAFSTLLLALPVIVLLHVNYVVWLGMAIAGYLVAWAVQAPWSRPVVRRHLFAATAVALVTVACLAVLLPFLRTMSAFGGGADTAFAEFRPLLVGTKGSFHLRPDLIVASGVLALVGLLGCTLLPLVPRLHREPVAWLLGGSALVVLALSQVNALFTPFSHAMSISQSKRIGYALPHALGFGVAAMLVGWWAEGWWRTPRRRLPVVGAVLAVGVVLQYVTTTTSRLANLEDAPVLPGGLVRACGVVLALTLLGTAALAVRNRTRTGNMRRLAREPGGGPVLPLGVVGVVATTVVLVMAGASGLRATASALHHDAAGRPSSSTGVDDLASVDAPVRRALVHEGDGRVVMAPVKLALRYIAVAPDYVAGLPLSHIAGTPKNRRADRRDKTNEFFSLHATDATRLHLLDTQKVDLVVLGNNPASPVFAFTKRHARVFTTLATGRTTVLLRVHRGAPLRRG